MDSTDLTSYLETALLPAMGISGRRFALEALDHSGTRSRVLLVRIEGIAPLLLRAWQARLAASRNVAALRHLDELGLPAPRLVFHDLALTGRWGREADQRLPYITIETFIEGRRLSDITDPGEREAALAGTAGLLRRFRQATRSRWGRPGRPSWLPFFPHAIAGARRLLRAISQNGWLSENETAATLARLGSWDRSIGAIRSFGLVHKDINPDNLIVGAGGLVTAVDLHRLAYEPFPEEIFNALRHICPDEPGIAAAFLDHYFCEGDDADRELFESTRGFFEVVYAIKRLARLIGRESNHPGFSEAPLWKAVILRVTTPA